jgi:predicted CopG family antitoxin
MSKRNTVGLRQEVYSRLKNKGRFGESFSELISRLLDESEEGPILNDGGKKFK